MTEPRQSIDATRAAVISSSAALARRQFAEGQHGRFHEGGTVHAAALYEWELGGLTVPGPACHVGSYGADFTRFKPTRDPITCKRDGCATDTQGRAAPPFVPHSAQLALDLDGH